MNNTVFINFEILLIRNDSKKLCLVRLKLNEIVELQMVEGRPYRFKHRPNYIPSNITS